MTRIEVQQAIDAIVEICGRYHVRELSVFGSSARGDSSEGSDCDFLVEFLPDARLGFLTLAAMARELAAILGCQVDLVPKGGLKERIKNTVLAEAEVLYAA